MKFEGLAQRGLRTHAANQNLCDLAARDRAIGWIAGQRFVALQHHQPVLIRLIVVEPGRTHDRVGQAARANQALGAPLPVV